MFAKLWNRCRRAGSRLAFAGAIVALFALYGTFFTVPEGFSGVVTRLGRPVREIRVAGAYWKWPTPIEQIQLIDQRRTTFVTPQVATFTRDKKSVVLTTYVVWHVERPLLFLQAIGDLDRAQENLAGMITAAKNEHLGSFDLTALVSLRRSEVRLAEIEADLLREVSGPALSRMGIAVDQVGIERIAFPEENMAAVLDRMRAEREAEANRLRSEGAKQAQVIRDDAHVKSQEILRNGREEASRISAATEQEAARTLAAAHDQAPEFFRFWSSLQASRRAIKEKSTLILRSDQLFFDSLTSPPAAHRLDRDRQPLGASTRGDGLPGETRLDEARP